MNSRNFVFLLSLGCWSSCVVVTSAFVVPTTRTAPLKQHQYRHDDQRLLTTITTTKRYLYVDPDDAQHGQATIVPSPRAATTKKKSMTKEEFHRSLLEARLRIEKKAKTSNEKGQETTTSEQEVWTPVSSSPLMSSSPLNEEYRAVVAEEGKDQQQQKSESQFVMESSKNTANVIIQPSDVQITGTTPSANAYNFQRSLLEARLQMESRAKERENLFQVVGAASILASSTTGIADTVRDADLTTTHIDKINDELQDDEDQLSIPASPFAVVVDDEDDIFATRTIIVAPPSETTDTTASSTVPTNIQSSSSSSYEFQRSLLERRLQMEKLAASKKDRPAKKSEDEEQQSSNKLDSMQSESSMTTIGVEVVDEPVEPVVIANHISDEESMVTTNGVMVAAFDDADDADDVSESEAKEIATSTTASVAATATPAKQPPMKDESVLLDVLSSIKPSDVLNTFTPEVGIVDLKKRTDDEIIDHVVSNFGNVMKYGAKAVGDTAKLAFLSRSSTSETTTTSAAAETSKSSTKAILDAAGMSTRGVVSVLTAMTALLWKKGGESIDHFEQLQKERAEEQRKAEEARVEAKRIEEIERSFQQQSNDVKEEMDKKRHTQEAIVSKEIHNLANNHKLMIDEKADMALEKAFGNIRIEIESEQEKRLQILQNNKDLLIAQKATATIAEPATPRATASAETPEGESSSTTKGAEIPFFATML